MEGPCRTLPRPLRMHWLLQVRRMDRHQPVLSMNGPRRTSAGFGELRIFISAQPLPARLSASATELRTPKSQGPRRQEIHSPGNRRKNTSRLADPRHGKSRTATTGVHPAEWKGVLDGIFEQGKLRATRKPCRYCDRQDAA